MMMSLKDLAARAGVSVSRAKKTIADLEELGFLARVDGGAFRLTMFPCNGQPATNDYMRPEAMQKFKQMEAERRAKYGRRGK
jgi:DeoR/GlpR family transcriptional regulator of sugar metabolism